MKKFLISFLLTTLIMIPTEIYAEETIPHSFSAGDTISADMMNEIFQKINYVTGGFSSGEDIVGTWSCKSTEKGGVTCDQPYALDTNKISYSVSYSVTFTDDGDGTFSYSSEQYLERCFGTSSKTGSYAIVGPVLLIQNTAGSIQGNSMGYIHKLSPIKFSTDLSSANQFSRITTCVKQNLPPAIPATLTASASGKTVSLTWTDSSTDETGFKVLRKDSLTGSYSTITTTSADATSYSDTVTTAGSYWYRVSATNSNGDSVASKMVKVDVE